MSMRDHEPSSGALAGSCPLSLRTHDIPVFPANFWASPVCAALSRDLLPACIFAVRIQQVTKRPAQSTSPRLGGFCICPSLCASPCLSLLAGAVCLCVSLGPLSALCLAFFPVCESRASPLCRSLSKFLQDPGAAPCWRVAQEFGVFWRGRPE